MSNENDKKGERVVLTRGPDRFLIESPDSTPQSLVTLLSEAIALTIVDYCSTVENEKEALEQTCLLIINIAEGHSETKRQMGGLGIGEPRNERLN